jgi:hypothetical protein
LPISLKPPCVGRPGLEVADRIADVVHQLEMAQPLLVDGVEVLDPALEEIGAFRGEHDARLAGDAGVDFGGAEDGAQGPFSATLGAHPAEHVAKKARGSRLGSRNCSTPVGGAADPAQVRRHGPGDEGDVAGPASPRRGRSGAWRA